MYNFLVMSNWISLIFIAFGLAMDAFAVGVSLTTLPIFIAYDAIVITSITFVIALIGVLLGQQINKLLKGKYSIANIIGGTILIILGITILIEHLM